MSVAVAEQLNVGTAGSARARPFLWPSLVPVLYFATFVTTPALALLQTRLLTRILPPADFGVIQLVTPVLNIVIILGGLGVQNYALRYFARDGARVVKEGLYLALAGSVAVVALLSMSAVAGSAIFGVTPTPALLVTLLAGVCESQLLAQLKVLYRSSNRHVLYSTIVVGERLASVLGAVAGVVLLRSVPAEGFLIGGAVGGVLALLILSPSWAPKLARAGVEITRKRLGEMLVYGAPAVGVLLIASLFITINRYVIVSSGFGLDMVAKFAVGYSLAALAMQGLYEPLLTYSHPRIFKAWEQGNRRRARSLLARLMAMYLVAALVIGIIFWLGEGLLLRLVAKPSYALPAGTFALLLVANLLMGVYRFLATWLLLKANPVELLFSFGIALLANTGASMLLIRPMGILGVGLACAASSCLLCGLVWWRARPIMRLARADA